MAVRDEVKKKQVDRSTIQKASSKKKDPPFLTIRTWVNFILSSIQKDRGRIPDNIGNKMMICNNMYITRYYMNSIIVVESLSTDTPVTLCSMLTNYLRRKGSNAVVDFTFKRQKFDINLKDSGWGSRERSWRNTANAVIDKTDQWSVTEKEQRMAVRCLYTLDKVRAGHKLSKTRIYITLRAKSGSALTRAEKLTYDFLNSINAEYRVLVGDIKKNLEYMSIISDSYSDDIKDIPAIITDNVTASQMFPKSGSPNGTEGCYLGNNLLNHTQFMLDWNTITSARNIYVIDQSGGGKTVIVANWCCSAVENGMAVCIMDIKGNEFNNFVNGTGGYIVSLRQESTGYINSWKMIKEDTDDLHAEAYFRKRIAFSKQQMMILSGLTEEEDKTDFEELLEKFHRALYTSRGVLDSNRNTWHNTDILTPFKVYEMFLDYMTPEMQRKYDKIARKVINGLGMFMSREGSKSYLFEQEFNYADILRAPTLMFDFGILEGATDRTDPVIFRLKFAYMRTLNAEYTAYKYSQGIKVFKVLEESQIAVGDPDIMKGYVEEFTLRRAQGQTTILIGNSIKALTDNPMSQALIENVKGILMGRLAPQARETAIKEFALEEYEPLLDVLESGPEYENSFLFINKMQQRPVIPILKIKLDKTKTYKLLSAIPKNINAISGGKKNEKQ